MPVSDPHPYGNFHRGLSLLHGWLPLTIELVAIALLVLAVVRVIRPFPPVRDRGLLGRVFGFASAPRATPAQDTVDATTAHATATADATTTQNTVAAQVAAAATDTTTMDATTTVDAAASLAASTETGGTTTGEPTAARRPLLGFDRGWWLIRLPICVVLGVAGAFAAWQYMNDEGLASDPAPMLLWVCVGGTVGALAVAVIGWPRTRWWHRVAAIMAVPVAAASSLVVLNQWVGYYPTWQAAWSAFTAGPLPHQTDLAQLAGMRDTSPATGVIVPVDIPDNASGFKHRTEYVYLPPAYFTGPTAPALPVVMMIAGEFNTPADWIRSGQIMPVIDKFTASNGGRAPILVFPDSSGSFNNDTECVDGPRGQAAGHLTKDVVPYVESTFNASKDPAKWAVIGWSMGGTCAVDLTVMHPELFHTFVDIAGDLGPASGTKEQSIKRLYGGDAAQWAAFDPETVMAAHGPYTGVTGLFDDLTPPKVPAGVKVPGLRTAPDGTITGFDPDAYAAGRADDAKTTGDSGQQPGAEPPVMPQGFHMPKVQESQVGMGGQDGNGFDTGEFGAAEKLCTDGRAVGIDCTVHTSKGGHTWQFAASAFGSSFPWVVATLGMPVPPAN